jgi:hypothetical protein
MTAGSDLIFIVGRQRSGTTVLREFLCAHGAYDADEVFHGDLSRPDRFYNFVLEHIKVDPSAVNPARHPALFDKFIERLRAKSRGAPVAIDLKYFAFNAMPTRDDLLGRRPYTVQYMQRANAHVLHVVRRNKLRIHVSEEIAKLTSRWSAQRQDQLPKHKPRLLLDPRLTLKRVAELHKEEETARKLLAACQDCREFVYEEMFDAEGNFTLAVGEIAKAILDVARIDRRPPNLRMNPEPLSELVENYEEVRSEFAATPFGWMVEVPVEAAA